MKLGIIPVLTVTPTFIIAVATASVAHALAPPLPPPKSHRRQRRDARKRCVVLGRGR